MAGRLALPDPALEDARVRLRGWRDTDLPCVREAALDPATGETTTLPHPYTDPAGRGWLVAQEARFASCEALSLAIAGSGSDDALGAAVLAPQPEPGVARIACWLAPRARGHGYASAGLRLLSHWALTDAGFARVEALVNPANVASLRMLERAGFTAEGRLRSYLWLGSRRADAISYSLLADELTPSG
ncbi:MAG TPA: GNAT family protein [Gaiellaceae bacterium]|jgi:RimJ/RimL family protein N-acetyltransferase